MRHTHACPPEARGVDYLRRHLHLGHGIDAPDTVTLDELVAAHLACESPTVDLTSEPELQNALA